MSSVYYETTDITDKLVKQFYDRNDSRIASWDAKVDEDVNTKAISLGVDLDDITSTINWKVKEYALAYLGMCVCFDNRYGNNNDTIDDKYRKGWEEYLGEVTRIGSQLTPEHFTEAQSSQDAEDVVGGGIIWRG